MHHPLSHEFNSPDAPEFLTRIDTCYSERSSSDMYKGPLDIVAPA
jgi:hypothetical protein